MRSIVGRTGARMPVLGQGTWKMGTSARRRREEAAILRLGLDLGLTLIDTAEMYADGGAEEVVAEAIAGRRDQVFLVSKVLPSNASRAGVVRAAERSLHRLRTDRIDLYLLHWKSNFPLQETLAGFRELKSAGKILHYGLSNFDAHEMESAERLEGGPLIAADQVLYNLMRRGIEKQLLPWCADHEVALMAYTPLEEGHLARHTALDSIARRHGASKSAVAIAWTLRHPWVVTIPKASSEKHARENAAAADLRLTAEDVAELDAAFPAPVKEMPLEMA
jgi:diketogulonate reductase-like aldo/keto reductase